MSKKQLPIIPVRSMVLVATLLLLAGCNTIPKRYRDAPVPEELVDKVTIPGIPDARSWGDQTPPYIQEILDSSKEEIAKKYAGIINRKHTELAISGGGSNGAYGSGILVGWTARGDRPKFTVVSGISTGSIIAPFAFLGAEYDSVLIDLYTNKSTKEVVDERKKLRALRRDAFTGTGPLRALLLGYIGDKEVELIAVEHRKGRRLLMGTVNMDMMRPVVWNIGAIADSGSPHARELIVDIILASSAVPVAMPPVFFDVEANGKTYQEMHVDGGLFSQVMTYPISIHWDEIEKKLSPKGQTELYIIRNAKMKPEWKVVQPKIVDLAGRSVASVLRAQGLGDIKQLYLSAKRDGIETYLTFIPQDFTVKSTEAFDKIYMKALFDAGYSSIIKGDLWMTQLD